MSHFWLDAGQCCPWSLAIGCEDVREASQVDKNKGRHYACKYRPSQKIGSVLDRELLNISGQMGDAMIEERGSP